MPHVYHMPNDFWTKIVTTCMPKGIKRQRPGRRWRDEFDTHVKDYNGGIGRN